MGSPVIHWQIITKDPEAHASFYEKLFGWTIDGDNPLGYRQANTGSDRGIDGGFWPAPPEAPNFVQLHIEVGSVDDAWAQAEALGAKPLIPPQALPEGGRMAVMHDPQGVAFALVER